MNEFIGKTLYRHNNAKFACNRMVLIRKIILYRLANALEVVLAFILSASKSGLVRKFKLEKIKRPKRLRLMICPNSPVKYVRSNFPKLYKLSKNILTSFLKSAFLLTCSY